MTLSGISVRRGVTFAMAYLIIFGFGLFSLSRLQLDLYPDISFPVVIVITNYTGASPEDIETLITRPIEGAVSSAKDAKEIRSTSKQGVSLVEVHFDWGKDMDFAETDVRRKLEMVTGFLPADADTPMVFAFDPSMQPVYMTMITGPYPLDELRNIAEDDVVPRLERLPGIATAMVDGGLEREIQIVLNPAKVAAFGLDVNAVIGAVYAENSQVPGGAIEQGTMDFTIQTRGKYQTVAEIGEVVVGVKMDGMRPVPIRLKEVAEIQDSFFESQRILEVNGVPSVFLMVRKQSGANTVRAANAVKDALPEIKRAAAAEIEFTTIFDQSDFIQKSLGNLSSTALIGVVITFFILLVFLRDLRSSLIVAAAIPLSVIATFAVMDQTGMTLNILSMAGLALAIGMLVDNAIVVLENVFRLRQEGQDAWTASIDGARTVTTAVTASTLTTVSVFVPVLFVPGIAGVMFKDLSVTICFSLAVSLMVALTFIPLAASRLLGGSKMRAKLQRVSATDPFNKLRDAYGTTLDWSLKRRWFVAVSVVAMLAGTGVLTALLPTEFMTQGDQSMLFVQAEAPVGTNLKGAYEMIREVAARIEKIVPAKDRKLVSIDVGIGKGFTSIFSKGVHAGLIRVPLVSPGNRDKSQMEYENLVREGLKGIPGLTATVAAPFNILGGEGDIEVRLRGHDLQASRAAGLELKDQIAAMPEVASVTFSMSDQKPEVMVRFDRRKMGGLGLSTSAVGRAISAYFKGSLAGRYADGGDEFDITVRYSKDHRLDVDELRRMPVVTQAGFAIPLANVADVNVGLGPVDITRLGQERISRLYVTLKEHYKNPDGTEGRKDLMSAIGRVQEVLDAYALPEEFSSDIGGSAEDFLKSFQYLGLALLVSVLLVYMVMASQFESLRQPFIIIFTVPLAAIGVILMFTLTRSTMDVSSLIGVIMLVGIVVNNGIVMVDAANQFREQGMGRYEAIAQAARIRLRPVLMTSLTTIMAMVPLALQIGEGSEGWAGMAKAVIGGLIASTLLTLFVVPTMYTLFAHKKHKPVTGTLGLPAMGGEA